MAGAAAVEHRPAGPGFRFSPASTTIRFPYQEVTMHRVMAVLILFAIATSIGGCACRSGYVGPAGGVHPPRCWIW